MMRGCVCRWCGEAVTEADERYEAMDGTAVHAECMEALLLETVGVEALAERMGYEHRREVSMGSRRAFPAFSSVIRIPRVDGRIKLAFLAVFRPAEDLHRSRSGCWIRSRTAKRRAGSWASWQR